MNGVKTKCASSQTEASNWAAIQWDKCEIRVRKLQARIQRNQSKTAKPARYIPPYCYARNTVRVRKQRPVRCQSIPFVRPTYIEHRERPEVGARNHRTAERHFGKTLYWLRLPSCDASYDETTSYWRGSWKNSFGLRHSSGQSHVDRQTGYLWQWIEYI